MKRITSVQNVSIRYKLFLSYVFVILIPFMVLLVINIHTTRRDSESNALHMAHKMLDETNSYLHYRSQAIMEALNFVAFNSTVQEKVTADPAPYFDVSTWHMDALKLSAVINQFSYNEDIAGMQLYMGSGLAQVTDNADFLDMRKVDKEPWFLQFAASNEAFLWLPSRVLNGDAASNEVSVLRKIPNSRNIQQFDGMVLARVVPGGIQSVLDHAVLTSNTFTMLFNKRGELLSASRELPLTDEQAFAVLNSYSGVSTSNYWDDHYMLNGKHYLLGIQDIPRTDMTVAMMVPYSDILASSDKARNRIVTVFLVIVPLMLPLSFIMTSRATKRILQLLSQIRMLKNGRFPSSPLPVSKDEIGELTQNFNEMGENIAKLIDETYLLGREVKNKELLALQAQINPHFLYNTLDLINVMAIESSASGISRVVEELAVFYKLSLSNGKEYVTLGNELKHVEAYLHIQNMRFGGGIRLQSEVPWELRSCRVPKILLQPLVENGIFHGIMEKEEEEGVIRISSWLEANDLLIEVADDGVGMEASQAAHLFQERSGESSKGSGYGVRNIQERLQLAYGPRYGLFYDSFPGGGTRVRIRIPQTMEEQRELPS